MSDWLRRPLLHFALLGAALFAVDLQLAGAPDRGVAALGDEELLLEEARALGLQHSDSLVRRRLVRNMRFLEADPQGSDAALFAEALELEMERSDPVARRRLVQSVVLDIRARARRAEPGEAELAAYLERHAQRFALPARVGLSQRYLGPGPAPLPGQLPPTTQTELAARLGEDFAAAVFALEPAEWHGPIRSSYGLHRVRIDAKRPGRAARLDEVRGAVREALLAERAEGALEERLAWLRARR